MIVVGAFMMLSCVVGGRLFAGDALMLVGGFTTVAVGSLLLTQHALALFFYFCYVAAIAILQLPRDGLASSSAAIVLGLFVLGCFLVKVLPKKRI